MKYKVNEIFRSVQTEGLNAGRSAIFVRFSGCNLNCRFCDTNFAPFVEMTQEEIDAEIKRLANGQENVLLVFTGGEPTMQLKETEPLGGFLESAIETNGILDVPKWINHVTVSPKTKMTFEQLKKATEVKLLYGLFDDEYLESLIGIHCQLFLQPMERNGKMNSKECLRFIEKHPEYRLSVQYHKLIGIR